MRDDIRLLDQLIFIYEEAIKFGDREHGECPPPVCIECKCRIIQSAWSDQVKETRRVVHHYDNYEIPIVSSIDYESD